MVLRLSDIAKLYLPEDTVKCGRANAIDRTVNHALIVHGWHVPGYSNIDDLIIINLEQQDLSDASINCFAVNAHTYTCAGMIIVADLYDKHIVERLRELSEGWEYEVYFLAQRPRRREKITRNIFNLLQCTQNQNYMIQAVVEALLYNTSRIRDEIYMLHLLNINIFERYRVAVIQNTASAQDDAAVYGEIQRLLEAKYQEKLNLQWKTILVAIIRERDEKNLTAEAKLEDIFKIIKEQFGIEVKIALGGAYEGLEHIRESLREAKRTLDVTNIIKNNTQEPHVYTYKMLSIYRVLYELRDESVFSRYIKDVFHAISSYDEKTNANLFETLETYFTNNLDLDKTASALFLHKNTLRYRIKKIEELLDCNLTDIHPMTEISLAFNIRRFLYILQE